MTCAACHAGVVFSEGPIKHERVRPVGDDERPVQTREDLDYYRMFGENKRKTRRRVINPLGADTSNSSFSTSILCTIEMFFIKCVKTLIFKIFSSVLTNLYKIINVIFIKIRKRQVLNRFY